MYKYIVVGTSKEGIKMIKGCNEYQDVIESVTFLVTYMADMISKIEIKEEKEN